MVLRRLMILLMVMGACDFARGEVGDLGVGGAAGAAFPVGEGPIRRSGSVGPALGAHLSYQATSCFSAEVSYDNLYIGNNVRIQPLILSGLFTPPTNAAWTPFVQLGAGVSPGPGEEDFHNFAGKAGIGLIFKAGHFSYGPQVIYHMVLGRHGNPDVYTLTPGVFGSWHFALPHRSS